MVYCKDFFDCVKVVKFLRYEINYFEFMLLNILFGMWVYYLLIMWIKRCKSIYDVYFVFELVYLG